MKAHQSLWSLLFLIGPAIFISIEFGFWNGILALIINFVLGAIVGQIALRIIPFSFLRFWSYAKGPLIAFIVIIGFYWVIG